MTMVREGQNPNHCRVVEADRRAPFAPTVASWCPPLDLWYTMGVRQSAKQQRTEEKMFRPLPNGEDDAPQPVLTDDQRESVCSDEDGMKLLSADPHLVSDCILMKRFKSNSQKRLHFGHKMAMESYEDEGSCNMIALSAEEIAEDLMKMTGKMPSRNGNRKRLMLKGYFPAERTKMLQRK
ncbi:unnamed protein product [Rhodiola kirilowii]